MEFTGRSLFSCISKMSVVTVQSVTLVFFGIVVHIYRLTGVSSQPEWELNLHREHYLHVTQTQSTINSNSLINYNFSSTNKMLQEKKKQKCAKIITKLSQKIDESGMQKKFKS